MTSPQQSLPIYAQIANELRRSIRQGVYKPGERLPTEAQLAERFGVNRHTLRRAVSLLKSEGQIRVDQGRGMFVATTAIRYPIGKRVRYNETLRAQGRIASYKLIRVIAIPADATIAREMEIKPGEPVVLMERLGLADGEPIDVATRYFPCSRLPNILHHCQYATSISKMFREIYGYDHLRRSTRVSARNVKPQDAQLLELPLNAPILLTEAVNVGQNAQVIEYCVTRFRGDRMELVFENDLMELLRR